MSTPISYDLKGAVEATSISERTLRDAIAVGSLTAHYEGRKLVIKHSDLDEYIESLPTERRTA